METNSIDPQLIKKSLNILKTNFSMKANLPIMEANLHQEWEKQNIYNKVIQKNENNKQWILHDGPPYANGDIHVGHVLNKILKDIVVRYKNAYGFYSPFILGWDCHGLPIEHAIAKKNEKKYNQLPLKEKRKMCYSFAWENIQNQKQQFKQLGLFTDYEKCYYTLNKDFESRQLKLFNLMLKKGLVYQAFKPVYWSWSSKTALAEAEIEYANVEAHSIYVKFNVVDGKNILNKNDQLLIWTTTPWTLPANVAVAINPNFEYALVKFKNENFVIEKSLVEKIASLLNWNDYSIIKSILGKNLENIIYHHPLYDKLCPIICANYVTKITGTGLVHNAPCFGKDDYLACKKYKIYPSNLLDDSACFNQEINDPQLCGVFYEDANEIILNHLKLAKTLLYQEKIFHSAAIDWRTKKPIIYRATKQWFIDISKVKNDIINALENVKFINQINKKHMQKMILDRDEWCISRQRVWGVPICLIYDENNNPILDQELLENIINILSNEGTDIWFEKPIDYFLLDKFKTKDTSKFTKCLDTMDVWFDSGSSHLMFKDMNLSYPVDLYLEGDDQYRGWFNSSIITSIIANNFSPYKQLISHGMCVDEQGRKMSKSLGNGIDPLSITKTYGSDILRLWVANSNYVNNVSISKNILNQIAEIYRKIRNSLFKFCLANIVDFDYAKHANFNFELEDEYVVYQLIENIKIINQAYENFNFSIIVKLINKTVVDLSSWYFDLIKDCLYCDDPNNQHRRAIQTILYLIVNTYTILLQPIIPHTCYEVYQFFNKANKKENLFLEDWINDLPIKVKSINQSMWKQIFLLKELVFAEIEKLRKIKLINKNNEVDVILTFNNENSISEALLKKIFNVAMIKINDVKTLNTPKIEIKKTNKIKCCRCWNYFDPNEIKDNLCPRCIDQLKKFLPH